MTRTEALMVWIPMLAMVLIEGWIYYRDRKRREAWKRERKD